MLKCKKSARIIRERKLLHHNFYNQIKIFCFEINFVFFSFSDGCPAVRKRTDPGWIAYQNYQYKFFSSHTSWSLARDLCHFYGADLAVYGVKDVRGRE